VAEVGGDAHAKHAHHRVLLQRPYAVVADDADDRDAVPDHGVELHRREAERPIARKQQDLPVWMGELGRHRVPRARTQAAEGPWVDPQARLGTLDQAPCERDEVAAVAD
jgi:hypothetical protein